MSHKAEVYIYAKTDNPDQNNRIAHFYAGELAYLPRIGETLIHYRTKYTVMKVEHDIASYGGQTIRVYCARLERL